MLDKLCIEQTGAGLCLNSAQRNKNRTRIDGELASLPIALVNPWLPEGLKTSGEFFGTFAIDQSKEGLRGAGKYSVNNGTITTTA